MTALALLPLLLLLQQPTEVLSASSFASRTAELILSTSRSGSRVPATSIKLLRTLSQVNQEGSQASFRMQKIPTIYFHLTSQMEVECGAFLRSKACCRTGTHHACSKHVHPCAKPTSSTNSPNPPNHPFPSPLTSLPPQVLVLVLLACPPARHTTPSGPTLYQQQHLPTTHYQSQCKCGSGQWVLACAAGAGDGAEEARRRGGAARTEARFPRSRVSAAA